MNYWKRSIRRWYVATYLGHNTQESNGPNICALTAHVTTRNNLESLLWACINIVWYKPFFVNLYDQRSQLGSTPSKGDMLAFSRTG